MLTVCRNLFKKQKFRHFLYVHTLFISGLIYFDIGLKSLIIDLLIFFIIVQPLATNIIHQHFNHRYVEFKNSFIEYLSLIFLVMLVYWKFTDLKSYHVHHHSKWLTDRDPTATEVKQGILKYYIGLTNPSAIPFANVVENSKFEFVTRYFFQLKFVIYLLIVLIFGLETLFHIVIVQQFFAYVFSKIHDITFHYSDDAKDLPWLFPLYFNDAWHIEHHKDFSKANTWHYRYINVHYWYNRILFK